MKYNFTISQELPKKLNVRMDFLWGYSMIRGFSTLLQ
jgi:hypothetical protein